MKTNEKNINKPKHNNIHTVRHSYVPALIVLFILSLASQTAFIYTDFISLRYLKETILPKSSLTEIVGTIGQLDEALTMSTHMFAATGDPQWEQRYQKLEPQLDTLINRAKLMAPDLYMGDATSQTNNANVALVNIEKQVFQLVKQGKPDTAKTLLESSEYMTKKQLYSKGFHEMYVSINKREIKQLNKAKNELLRSLLYAVIMLPLLLFVWISFVRTIRKYNNKRMVAEYELISAKEKAEENDRLKSTFLANMSHEIRTPINGILGFAELLYNPELKSAKQQEFVGIIEKSGKRLLNIINNLINISKIESGQMEVSISATNINEQIEFIYNFFKPEVERKGMQLFYKNQLPAQESIIKTDREKIYGILTNLVKNAIKYSDDGIIEFGYEKKGKYFEFFVKDTGIGIPKDRQEAIFERFIQADISDKKAKQGAGLGLSISEAYVKMLGGKMWVESKEGEGSIFYFTIPYNNETVEKNVIQNIIPADEAENHVKNLKILIAEDEEISKMLLTIMVKKFSQEVLIATTGVEACEICRNNPAIDLILMDISMPEMDGYEATRQIRQFNKDVVIISQTAFGLNSEREKAIEAGCNDQISKPILKNELMKLIQKYFNK